MEARLKKAYLLSCSDHYHHRLFAMDDYLRSKGYETVYLTGNFNHDTKEYFQCNVPHCVQLPTRAYKRNLSISRILNHWGYARDAFRYLEALPEEPGVVVSLLPPNFLAYYGERYKKKHPRVTLIFDIFDLWPETFPFGKIKKLLSLPFGVWSNLRDRHLSAADKVLAECDLFGEKLGRADIHTVYLTAQRPEGLEPAALLPVDELRFCYLGAINNIIDIPAIAALLEELTKRKPVTLHIIGGGERQQELIDAAKDAGAAVVFHGIIYDETEKHAIINNCHFGLNLMKSTVCVGLTMKSVDYFKHDLPIINSIPADTQRLVERERTGLNLNRDTVRHLLSLTAEECQAMRKNARRVFDEQFALSLILQRYDALLRDIV